MPEPRAMNIAAFPDDVMLIPGTHRLGVLKAGHDLETTTYPLWCLDRETASEPASSGGVVAPAGRAGCVPMFHSNMAHAGPPNISPLSRVIVYLSLCEVSNHISQVPARRVAGPARLRADRAAGRRLPGGAGAPRGLDSGPVRARP